MDMYDIFNYTEEMCSTGLQSNVIHMSWEYSTLRELTRIGDIITFENYVNSAVRYKETFVLFYIGQVDVYSVLSVNLNSDNKTIIPNKEQYLATQMDSFTYDFNTTFAQKDECIKYFNTALKEKDYILYVPEFKITNYSNGIICRKNVLGKAFRTLNM